MSNPLFTLTAVSAALLSLSVPQLGFAAEQIETLYVSATRSETAQVPIATQIKVISAEEIRVSGASSIAEVLRSQAGIQIQDSDGTGSRSVAVSMRGFSATAINNTLVLVDGRKLNNPSLAGPALNTVALKDIERVEIIQGSAGVLYGDQAVGGVINVITHKAKQGELNGTVTVERGSDDLERYTASANQGFANGLHYSLSAQKLNTDNFRDNNESSIGNLLGNIGFAFDGGRVFLEGQKVNDNLRLAGSLSDAEAVLNPRATNSPDSFSDQDTLLQRIGGEVDVGAGWKLLGEYSDRDEEGNYSFGYPGEKTTHYAMHVKSFSPRVVGNLTTANGNAIMTAGYDGVESNYRSNNTYAAVTSEQRVDGYYAQLIYPLLPKLTATLGSRYSVVDDKNYLGNLHNDKDLQASELGVNYQVGNGWRIFSRYAESFRFANPDENNAVAPGVSFLEPQTGESIDVGTAWQGDKASVSYSLYAMNIDDEIMYDSVNYANINLPKSERKGFIFDGDVQLSEQIGLHGNYTYTDARLAAGGFSGNEVPFIARDVANVGLVFNFFTNVTAAFDANYVGSRYRAGDDANSAELIDALTLFNFNILWDIQDIELGLRIKNITAEKYADYQSLYGQFPQPGRSYNAHISYRF